MQKRSVKLTKRHERWIYVVLVSVYVTGVAWMILHFGVNRGDGLRNGWHILETWLLRTHGATAMAALMALGSMLPMHVPTAWKVNRNLASGIGMLAALFAMAVTGWLLYYASGEGVRAVSSYAHMFAGVAGPAILVWHLAARRKHARWNRRGEHDALATAPHAETLRYVRDSARPSRTY